MRKHDSLKEVPEMFEKDEKICNAYKKDIAVLEIYLRKSSVIQMSHSPRMNWIEYLSYFLRASWISLENGHCLIH
jgi:hypothetical protein